MEFSATATMSGKQVISLMTWNINGLKKKVAQFSEVADDHKINIAFLQETHIGKHEIQIIRRKLRRWKLYSTGYRSNSKGVAILILRNAFEDFQLLAHDTDEDGSYIILRCIMHGQFFTLVSMYQHSDDKDITGKLIPNLQDCSAGVLLIGGDFNTSLHSYLDRTSRTEDRGHAVRRRWVQDFMSHLSLVDVWRSSRPMDREYTYSKNGYESRLDYIFMQEEFMWHVKTCEILHTPLYSDHKPVRVQLTTSLPSQLSCPDLDDMRKMSLLSLRAELSYGKDQIKLNEITRALRTILKSELPRPDAIPVNFYKSNIDNVSNHLKVLYNQMLDNDNDATIQMSFNGTIRVSKDNPYHIFNVDYLILATILATHLKKHLNSITEPIKEGDENKTLKVIYTRRYRKLKWSLLETAIKELKDNILLPLIFVKLLGPNQESDCIELRDGCPLTSPLLLLYWKYLFDRSKERTSESWPSDLTSETIIHGETVVIKFSFKPDAILLDRIKEKLHTLHYSAN